MAGFIPLNRAKHHIGHHVDESRIVIDRFGARHRQPEHATHVRCLMIEVIQHFDVIADEANGTQNGGSQPEGMLSSQIRAHVRLEPRIFGAAAATLIHQRPIRQSGTRRDEPRCLQQFLTLT